ncbi:hypothetical protein O6R05_07200 [Peptoniphilus equinus]|uniref:Deacetylase PdaC domain-containing protein n=1 Tax=Peptoniphilus equinus TaxID=3016343 RepID=A0ABY7QSR7_9FIRM|nr:DUF6612 family protein [Peptoniphilus equinus]WBW49782.1 hypothetical protein O6R05_07200 [Peptoniphilus equinus]
MKKYLVVPLLLVLFLAGCSQSEQNNASTDAETASRDEVFSKLLTEQDLMSYDVTMHNEAVLHEQSDTDKEVTATDGSIQHIKEPKAYHATWEHVTGDIKRDIETYVTGETMFYRENGGAWRQQTLEEEVTGGDDVPTFKPETTIDSNSILKDLERYYELAETEASYIATLASSADNIADIQSILFGDSTSSFVGELTSITAQFSFEKETYLPTSFEWEASFLNKASDDVTRIKQSGTYDAVNQLETIDIPEAIKSL